MAGIEIPRLSANATPAAVATLSIDIKSFLRLEDVFKLIKLCQTTAQLQLKIENWTERNMLFPASFSRAYWKFLG
jgi:hypothetical protein